MPQMHRTKMLLIETLIELLRNNPHSEITVDQVLTESGVSRGSLYHHFKDFSDLWDATLVHRFSQYIDDSVGILTSLVHSAQSTEEVREGLRAVTRFTQAPERVSMRFERIMPFAYSIGNANLAQMLADEQERLTGAIQEIIQTAKDKGFFAKDVDSRAAAVLIQAYTLGNIVNDVTPTQMQPDAWFSLIDKIVDQVFTTA